MCFCVVCNRVVDHPNVTRLQDQWNTLMTNPFEDAAYSFF
jgi:hypothetical protein